MIPVKPHIKNENKEQCILTKVKVWQKDMSTKPMQATVTISKEIKKMIDAIK